MDNIDRPSAEYSAAHESRLLDADLWGGRKAMREAGTRRLPRLPAESIERWKIRLSGARFYPAYPQAVRSLAGRLRESNIMPAQTVSEQLQAWFWDNKAQNILYESDIDGLRNGHSFLIADGDNLKNISAADMLEFWPLEGELEYVRFKRLVTKPGGIIHNLIYVIERLTESLINYSEYSNESGNYELLEISTIQMDYFPVIKFRYSEEQFEPYFIHVAALNEAHWQSSAYQVHAEAFARFNLLWGRGLPEDARLSDIGPHALVRLGEGGELGALEGGGAGIAAGRADLRELEQQMAALSARPLQADGNRTATEVGRDAAGEDAPIRRLADMRIEAVRQLLRAAGSWLRLDMSDIAAYDVTGNTEFTPIVPGAQDAAQLLQALVAGAIDGETYRQAIVNAIPALRGVDPADIGDRLGGGA